MCGIALVISGIRIDLSCLLVDSILLLPRSKSVRFSLHDLKAALDRRGPDSLGIKTVFLHLHAAITTEEDQVLSSIEGGKSTETERPYLRCCGSKCACLFSSNGESYERGGGFCPSHVCAELHFIGATLQLRGLSPIMQPLVDTDGNVLLFNGEIFGGIQVGCDNNDTETLMHSLGKCCSCSTQGHKKACFTSGKGKNSILELLSMVKGPWALIYWQNSSKTLWFGRDAFGRRSLLVHWPNLEDPRFLLSSVSPHSSIGRGCDFELEGGTSEFNFWEELPCGFYSISVDASKMDGFLVGKINQHEWMNPMLKELIRWERTSVDPRLEDLQFSQIEISKEPMQPLSLAWKLLNVLRESVTRRTAHSRMFKDVSHDRGQVKVVPVAVLFSGGLDSMILAALLDECLDPCYDIDLLNVSFDGNIAPDRISARAGLEELKQIKPSRRWKLVEIDSNLSDLTLETKHVMSLINPSKTYMDLNIGIALWLASGGDGWLYEGISNDINDDHQRIKYKSEARILLVGAGADEQCAGYGRHKTKYRNSSWLGLHEEMKLDMQRIWKRNLGRDDRCISDQGKEARFPFLDEDVIKALLDVPLWEVADLSLPSGLGDKKILRQVARLLGLHEAASLPKRAIQFGSRIARESNRNSFGSNRAGNQASAGSAVIYSEPW